MERRGKYVSGLRWIMLVGLIAILCLAGSCDNRDAASTILQFVVVEDDTGRELRFLASPGGSRSAGSGSSEGCSATGPEGLLIAASENCPMSTLGSKISALLQENR